MSTDYGFKCLECGTDSIIDNLRYSRIDTLKQILENLKSFEHIRSLQLDDVQIEVEILGCYQVNCAIDFAIDHWRRGHTVVVADEYGRARDQCSERWKCDACGHQEPCSSKEGHEGEHRK
jgi:hypothetical protein